ncbi:hypothetical protein [Streptomyces sp. GS7]|uniref:hypothetical protein n=1 Tax=Streptomyces sp. GS7 TaxID=2692234 RepID=UPI001F44B58F|nr:hypothetical protein [Streptomyces sp. GS7]
MERPASPVIARLVSTPGPSLAGTRSAAAKSRSRTRDVWDRARTALTEALRAHEAAGAVRLRSAAWLVTAGRPA